MNSLVYVDKQLIVPIGAKLIGSSLSTGTKSLGSGGFNWFIQASLEMSHENGVQTRIAELFPEDIFNYLYEKISNKETSVRDLCSKISHHELYSADVVSVVGKLNIPGATIKDYNPFDPPTIELQKTYKVYGMECFAAEIESDAYKFPLYFLADSKEVVCYANHKPVEIIGVLKWSPSYEIGGFAINQVLLAAALLLRR